MTKRITVPYFSIWIKFFSPVFFAGGLSLAGFGLYVWGTIAVLLGVIILTTKYVTEIDLKDKKYNDYLFFLGLSLNKDSKTFRSLDRIVITRGDYAQTLNTRIQSRQLNWRDYTGTLLLDNDTLDLLTNTSKKELLVGLKEFSDFLKVGVEDRTTNQYFWIDMSRVSKNS